MLPQSLKTKTCKQCKQKFVPDRPGQIVHANCVREYITAINDKERKKHEAKKRAEAKVERKTIRARKQALKSRQDWLAECQQILNKYVRLRDRDLGCCSCDRPASWDGQWHASHLRSVGAASAVRFCLWNLAKGCSICNNHLSGNIGSYLPRARLRWGDERIDWVYAQNQLVRYEIPYLERFKAVMGRKLKRLETRIEH